MKGKLKILKLLLILLMWLIFIVAVYFLIHSYTRLSDKKIPEEYFYNKLYVTQDSSVRLIFGDSLEAVRLNSASTLLSGEYKENILTLTGNDEAYTFIVIDNRTIFGDTTGYMYLIGD